MGTLHLIRGDIAAGHLSPSRGRKVKWDFYSASALLILAILLVSSAACLVIVLTS